MARYVNIASFGGGSPSISSGISNEDIDKAVTAHLFGIIDGFLPLKPDIIVLPEMCDMSSSFTMAEYVTYIKGRGDNVLNFICDTAKKNKLHIIFPTLRCEKNGNLFNCAYIIDNNGNIGGIYDKLYPTTGELEAGVRAGKSIFVYECEYGRIGFAICFDLNYTKLAEQYAREKTDIIIFPALFQGGILQQIWAYNSRSYFIGASYNCGASVVAPTGEILSASTSYYPWVAYKINCDCRVVHLDFNKQKIDRAIKKYGKAISLRDPGGLGCVLLICESEELCIDDIIGEFDIESYDDYIAHAEKAVQKSY